MTTPLKKRCFRSSSPAPATDAAAAARAAAGGRDEVREALARDLEAARLEADRAFRQYDAADPENRLVNDIDRWVL